MSHRTKPTPCQSRDQRGPRVVRAHAGVKSLGTHLSRKTIIDPMNGRSVGRGSPAPEGASAPGASGPAETGPCSGDTTPMGSW
jgi:hypothetical protein